jgi:hypothetical protein
MKRPSGRYYFYPMGRWFTHGTFEDMTSTGLALIEMLNAASGAPTLLDQAKRRTQGEEGKI